MVKLNLLEVNMIPKAVCSWSGGKDSCLAIYRARQDGVKVSYLLNMVCEEDGRSASHGLRAEVLAAQARALGIPIVQPRTARDKYEEVFKAALLELKR